MIEGQQTCRKWTFQFDTPRTCECFDLTTGWVFAKRHIKIYASQNIDYAKTWNKPSRKLKTKILYRYLEWLCRCLKIPLWTCHVNHQSNIRYQPFKFTNGRRVLCAFITRHPSPFYSPVRARDTMDQIVLHGLMGEVPPLIEFDTIVIHLINRHSQWQHFM